MTSEDKLCPLDDRRTSKELYIKLFVVYFSVIISFAHLFHIRRDYRLAASPLTFMALVSPITAATYLLLPVICSPILLILMKGDLSKLGLALRILIGQRPKENAQVAGRHRPLWKTLLRLIPFLGILAQSTTSIYYFSIRYRSGGAALYDHYILQLACLAALTSCFSCVHLLLEPLMIAPPGRDVPRELRWLLHYRAESHFSKTFSTWQEESWFDRCCIRTSYLCWHLIFLSLLGIITTLFSSIWGLDGISGFTPPTFLVEITTGSAARYARYIMLCMSIVFSLCCLCTERVKKLGLAKKVAVFILFGVGFIFAWFIVVLTFEIVKFGVVSGGWYAQIFLPKLDNYDTVVSDGASFLNICDPGPSSPLYGNGTQWNRISTFDAFPINCPCPKALKNDIADWLWMLA